MTDEEKGGFLGRYLLGRRALERPLDDQARQAGVNPERRMEMEEPPSIPTIEPEPPAACANIPGGYFQFLDDACKARQEPSFVDRDLACPSLDTSAEIPLKDGGTVTYQPGGEEPKFDTAALSGIVPSELMATVILIRRVNGKPHYRYLSTGDHDTHPKPAFTIQDKPAHLTGSEVRGTFFNVL